jgi:hypothetical protein
MERESTGVQDDDGDGAKEEGARTTATTVTTRRAAAAAGPAVTSVTLMFDVVADVGDLGFQDAASFAEATALKLESAVTGGTFEASLTTACGCTVRGVEKTRERNGNN